MANIHQMKTRSKKDRDKDKDKDKDKGKSQNNAKNTTQRIVRLKKDLTKFNSLSLAYKKILDSVIKDLVYQKKENRPIFKLSENFVSEIETLNDDSVLRYIVHRYRYEIFTMKKLN